MEEWKTIEGFPEYEVSTLGRVRKVHYFTLQTDPKGYHRVNLCQNNKVSGHLIHRLVASAFIPKVEGKEEVDHINKNRSDNRVENLRWADRYDQMNNTKMSREEKYIQKQPGGSYHLRIIRKKTVLICKSFPTLEEAVQQRETILALYNDKSSQPDCL